MKTADEKLACGGLVARARPHRPVRARGGSADELALQASRRTVRAWMSSIASGKAGISLTKKDARRNDGVDEEQ
jgi:hypothetical protein